MKRHTVYEDATGFDWGDVRVSRTAIMDKGHYVITVKHRGSGRWIEIEVSPAGKNFHIITDKKLRYEKL